MAKIHSSHNELVEAVRAMGIVPELTTKVVIEIDWRHGVNVYIEQLADESVIKVVRELGSEVHVVREVKSDG